MTSFLLYSEKDFVACPCRTACADSSPYNHIRKSMHLSNKSALNRLILINFSSIGIKVRTRKLLHLIGKSYKIIANVYSAVDDTKKHTSSRKAHKENTNHTVWRPKVDVRYSNDSESKNLLTYCLSLIHLNFRGFGEKVKK